MKKFIMEKKWNYKGVKSNHFFGTQADWNQTLLTQMSYVNVQRHQDGVRTEPDPTPITTSEKFKPLFETLQYYDKETQLIAEKYKIYFTAPYWDSFLSFPGGDYKIIIENFNP